jgi:hypothetical protein
MNDVLNDATRTRKSFSELMEVDALKGRLEEIQSGAAEASRHEGSEAVGMGFHDDDDRTSNLVRALLPDKLPELENMTADGIRKIAAFGAKANTMVSERTAFVDWTGASSTPYLI